MPGEVVEFSPRCTTTANRLNPEESVEYGVSVLKMVTPPYADPLTQRRTELPPALTNGVWAQTWEVIDLFPIEADKAAAIAANLIFIKTDFINQVKAEAGSITQQVLQGLGSEYELAEKEATDYKAAGYPATPVPSSVQSEVNSKAAKSVTITTTVACDAILAAATAWRTAQAELRDERLSVSSAADVAGDAIELDALKTQWSDFTAALKTQLGI